MAGVSIRSLNKKYGSVHAVRDANIEVEDGEFMVFVGPSGCGKTTTLRLIAGLEDITDGDIYIGDRRVNELAPKDRDIAMVFQNYALYPHKTIRANLAFGLKMRRMPTKEIASRVDETARLLEITELLDRKPGQLSGGQRQRVALGRAIVRHPQVFLFDEPLSNLDAKLRLQMRAELKRLHQALGVTSVYVTHDQVEAMTLGTRVVVMRDGLVQQIGEPMDVYRNPNNIFVAGFLGSPPMNFIQVPLDGSSSDIPDPVVSKVRSRLKDKVKDVTLGVRPEDMRLDSTRQKDELAIPITIETIEPVGAEILVHAKFADTPVIARLDPDARAEIGQKAKLYFSGDRMCLFDPITEERLQ